MRISTLRRSRSQALPGIISVARVDRRAKSLVRRLQPGEIAVIDHLDMDRATAVALADAGVVAVVNAAPSISGRYPNLGPRHLVDSGVLLVDGVGGRLISAVHDGDVIRIDGASIYAGDELVGTGHVQDRRTVERAMEEAKKGIPTQLEALSANAVEQLRRESRLFLDGAGVPMLGTPIKGRHVLIVVKAFDYRRDLSLLKAYLRESRPVLIGVDAGADALLEAGHRPDVIVTDGEDISDQALRCGAEVVLRVGQDGRVAHGARIERLGVRHGTFGTDCQTEDAALLIAGGNRASMIVTAGMPDKLEELIDKGWANMASSFLTRATLGSRVADAKAVSQLYRHRLHGFLVFLFFILALGAIVAALATTPVGQDWWDQLHGWLFDGYDWARRQIA